MLTDGMEEERQATAIFYPMGACLAFSSIPSCLQIEIGKRAIGKTRHTTKRREKWFFLSSHAGRWLYILPGGHPFVF